MQTRIYFTQEKTKSPDSHDPMNNAGRAEQFAHMLQAEHDEEALPSVMIIENSQESVSEDMVSPSASLDGVDLIMAPSTEKQFYLIPPQRVRTDIPEGASILNIPPSVLIRWFEQGVIKTQKGLDIPIDWLSMSIVHGLVSGGYWMGMQWDKATTDGWSLTNSTAMALSMLPLAIATYYPLAIMRFRYTNERWPTATEKKTIWGNALQVGVTVTFNAVSAITGLNIAEDYNWVDTAGFSNAEAWANWGKSVAVTSSGSLVGMTLSDGILEYLRQKPQISSEVERALNALGVENAEELTDFALNGQKELDHLIATRNIQSNFKAPKPKCCESLWLYLCKAPYQFITSDRTWLGVSAFLSHAAWITLRIANPLGRALTSLLAIPTAGLTFWSPAAIAEKVKSSECSNLPEQQLYFDELYVDSDDSSKGLEGDNKGKNETGESDPLLTPTTTKQTTF